MIPTYQSRETLPATLRSVLDAVGNRDDVQIEVVDDASPDGPEEIVREFGDPRVSVFRQPENVGHTGNFNTCLERARGDLVHLLHGDDLVAVGFYEAHERAFDRHSDVGASFCRHRVIDDHGSVLHVARTIRPAAGVLDGWLDEIAAGNPLQAPTMTVRRSVYEHVGGYDRRIRSYGEDWEMWVRIAAAYDVHYDPEPLASYRVRPGNLTHHASATGDNLRELRDVTRLVRMSLPADRRDRLTRAADVNTARGGMRRALRSYHSGDRGTAKNQIRASLEVSRSPVVLKDLVLVVARMGAWEVDRMVRRRGHR